VATVAPALAEDLRDATALNPYAVAMRYPSDLPPLTEEKAAAAVCLAAKVRRSVLESLPLE
jgi:hypothetical protein